MVAEAGVKGRLNCKRYRFWGRHRPGESIDRKPAFRHYSDVHVTTRIVNVERGQDRTAAKRKRSVEETEEEKREEESLQPERQRRRDS